MSAATLVLNGKRFVVIEESEYQRLAQASGEAALPPSDSRGFVPAISYSNASIARKLARRRKLVDLTQAALAKRAGLRVETINRIELGKNIPDTATVLKIDKALKAQEKKIVHAG